MNSSKSGSREKVRVVVRVRPFNNKELAIASSTTCVKLQEQSLEISVDEAVHNFQFDRVFGPESNQLEVFEYTATPLILDVLSGYNATIFAYGQTGTGKTHTMEGDIRSANGKGIIPRVVEALFDAVSEADESIEFTFKVTYVEIYMEKIRDLLDETRVKVNLTIREDKQKGIYVAGVTEEYVTSHEELMGIMGAGALNRATAATGMNEGSSRSHSVFTVTVNQKDTRSSIIKSGKLVLVDLAGSEMVRKSNAQGVQLEEAKTINKSLSALGQVIFALTDDKQTHVPYRDSKLTRILQDSLGGNSKTVLIVALSPSSFNAPESLSTCRFGVRAKSIENKVTVNQSRSPEELEGLLVRAEKAIDAQTSHILALTAELQAQQALISKGGLVAGSAGDHANTDQAFAAEALRNESQQAMMSQMQEIIRGLSQELEEERAEGTRKDAETGALTLRIKEKENYLVEAGELLLEAQKHYETQRGKAEQLLREKAAVIGENQSSRDQLQAELEKAQFDLQELEVTAETLRIENKQMVQEISDISGDAAVERTQSAAVRSNTSPKDNYRNNVNSNADAFSPNAGVTDDGDSSIPGTGSLGMTLSSNIMTEGEEVVIEGEQERALRAQEGVVLLRNLCATYGLDKQAGEALGEWLEGLTSHQEGLARAFETKLGNTERRYRDQTKKIKDMEVQRKRLEADLLNRSLKITQLNIEMSNLQLADGETARDMVSERERTMSKSLQQRLEQLVAIHRQLLRKFAMLELENGESKKKIQLRDERIRQLENSSRSLTGNMRNQAERHVSELTCLREQIQILRIEHQERLDAQKANDLKNGAQKPTSMPPPLGKRTVRGGTHAAAPSDPETSKSVRGGAQSFTQPTPSSPGRGRGDLDEESDAKKEESFAASPTKLVPTPTKSEAVAHTGAGNRLSGLFSRVLGSSSKS